jgi:hypothetical protein
MFHLRYTGLFETIPHKNAHYQNSNDYFDSIKVSALGNNSLELGLIAALIACILLFYILLLVCLDKFINKTIMLFGYMNTLDIDKEVTNCKVFLEIFFKDSYSVKLSTKKKNNDNMRNTNFTADDVNLSKLKSQNNNGSFNEKNPNGSFNSKSFNGSFNSKVGENKSWH